MVSRTGHVSRLAGNETAVAHESDPDSDIDPLVDRVADAVRQAHVQGDTRMTCSNTLQCRQYRPAAQAMRCGELYVKKSKFSEEQIVRILKEVEAGAKVAETCRKHGISDPTYYAWKAKYAGMDVSQLRQLKELQAENAKLKKMYAELALVIEHDMRAVMQADWVIDVGPGAGDAGGRLVASGTPHQVSQETGSRTALFLAQELQGHPRNIAPVK